MKRPLAPASIISETLCYALSDELYDGEWGEKHDYEPGDYSPLFAVDRTKYGDGRYEDGYGHHYPVDSGTIALVNITDEKTCRCSLKELEDCGRIIPVKKRIEFFAEDGTFTVVADGDKSWTVYTGDEEDDEEEYYEDYDE